MVGGAGTDSLTGGLGSDLFDFNAIMETAAGTDRDVITDFAAGDKIDLATIDAILGQPDDQAFAFAAGAAFSETFSAPGQLFYDGTTDILWGNNDADAQADFSILVKLSGLTTLVATNFVLYAIPLLIRSAKENGDETPPTRRGFCVWRYGRFWPTRAVRWLSRQRVGGMSSILTLATGRPSVRRVDADARNVR